MIDRQEFFIDLINAIPSNTEWLLQSSFTRLFEAIKGIPYIDELSVVKINFQDHFRKQISELANNNLYECINDLEIFENGKKLLEAFDGFVIVTVSKNFNMEDTNLSKYLNNDLLFISDVW
jgi:hypothetical protein